MDQALALVRERYGPYVARAPAVYAGFEAFRWMDLTGVPAYHTVMKDLFPTLNNQTTVPKLIDDIVKAGGRGIHNGKGFYEYTPEEARQIFIAIERKLNEVRSKFKASDADAFSFGSGSADTQSA